MANNKVKTKHGEFEVKPLSFKERRELHRREVQAANIDGELDFSKYIDLINWVLHKALVSPQTVLDKFNDTEIDEIGSDIYMHYKEGSKKKTKKSEY